MTMIVYIIGNFPSNYLIEKGTKLPVCLAMVLIVSGSWIKCLINFSFYFTHLGMFFIGIGLFLLLNSMVNISLDWFGPKERIVMTSMSNMISFGSIAIGFFLPGIFVNPDETDKEVSKKEIWNFLFYSAVIVTPGLLTLVFYKNKPPTPPSKSANNFDRD